MAHMSFTGLRYDIIKLPASGTILKRSRLYSYTYSFPFGTPDHVFASLRRQNASCCAVDLPFEILSAIFEIACLDDECSRTMALYSLEMLRTRHAIALTCTRWKEVLDASPAVWSTFSFVYKMDTYGRSPGATLPSRALLDTCLKRASTHPLYISIPDTSPSPHEDRLHLERVLRENAPRIRALDMQSVPLTLLLTNIGSPAIDCSQLMYLKISVNMRQTYIPVERAFDLRSATRLESLWLCVAGGWSSCLLPPSPKHCRIKRLHIEGIGAACALEIIASCTETLRQLSWSHREDISELKTFSRTELSSLRTLSIDGGIPSQWMSTLSAPCLEELQVRGMWHWGNWLGPTTLASSKELRRFQYFAPTMLEQGDVKYIPQVAKFLTNQTMLEEVFLGNTPLDPQLVEAFCVLDEDEVIKMRKLKHIWVTVPETFANVGYELRNEARICQIHARKNPEHERITFHVPASRFSFRLGADVGHVSTMGLMLESRSCRYRKEAPLRAFDEHFGACTNDRFPSL